MSALTNFQNTLSNLIDINSDIGQDTKDSLKDCIYSVTPGEGPGPEEDLLRIVQVDRDTERRNSDKRQGLYVSGLFFSIIGLVIVISLYLIVPILDFQRPQLVTKMIFGGETKGFYNSLFLKVIAGIIAILILTASMFSSRFGNEADIEDQLPDGIVELLFNNKDKTEFSVESPSLTESCFIIIIVAILSFISVYGIKTFMKAFRTNRKYFETITSKYDPEAEFQYEECEEFKNIPITMVCFGFMALTFISGIGMGYVYIDQLSSPWYLFTWMSYSVTSFFIFGSIAITTYMLLYYNFDTKIKCDETLFVQPQQPEQTE